MRHIDMISKTSRAETQILIFVHRQVLRTPNLLAMAFSTMQRHAQARIRWLNYTTVISLQDSRKISNRHF